MCSAPAQFLPIVTDMLTSFEKESANDVEWIEKSAKTLIESGDKDSASKLLTYYSHTRASKALEMGNAMNNALDGYIKLKGMWKGPVGKEINDANEGAETVNRLVGFDPDQPPNKQKPVMSRFVAQRMI